MAQNCFARTSFALFTRDVLFSSLRPGLLVFLLPPGHLFVRLSHGGLEKFSHRSVFSILR